MQFLIILLASIASMLLGMLWYSPSVFGKKWMKLSKIDIKQINKAKKQGMAGNYIAGFISTIITAIVLKIFIMLIGVSTASEGLLVGLLASIGFIATTSLGMILWERKPLQLYTLNVSYNIVSFMLMGAILAAWN